MSVEFGELGEMVPPGVAAERDCKSFVISLDGKHLYALGIDAKYALEAFVMQYGRDGETGALTRLAPYKAETLWFGEAIAISPDGKHVYIAAGGGLSQYGRNAETGQLTPLEPPTVTGIEPGTVTAMTVSPDGRNVYTLHYFGEDDIHQLRRDSTTGLLTLLEPPTVPVKTIAKSGIGQNTSIAISPDGRHVYSVGHENNNQFSRDPLTGALTEIGWYTLGAPNPESGYVTEYGGVSIAISPDGHDVYIGQDGLLIIRLPRDRLTGLLTLDENYVPDGGEGFLRMVTISSDGSSLLTYSAGGVEVYVRDPETGEILETDSWTTLGEWVSTNEEIAISPDGKNVYVSTYHEILQFTRATTEEAASPRVVSKLIAGPQLAGMAS
jgi:3-carboxymuconate cyclase